MDPTRDDLVGLSDFVWHRLWRRLDGLTDAEYHWEPVPRCRGVRRLDDGTCRSDGPAGPGETPGFTTLAWRVCHLIDNYGGERNGPWLGLPVNGRDSDRDPGAAAEARAELERSHQRWRALLAATTDATLAEPIGPAGGPFADGSRRSYVLHVLDEVIHHGAEVGVLRDLYRDHYAAGAGAATTNST